MKIKKRYIILAAVLAVLVIAAVPLAAFAAENEDTSTAVSIRPLYGGLEMVAPHAAPVNQTVNLQVFARQTLLPVPGAGIWAISRDLAENVKNDLKTLRQSNPDPAEAEIEAVLNPQCIFMGRTGEDGKLSYAFAATGTYVMIAFKAHYWPDCNVIVVGNGALCITAPKHVPAGEPVTMSVTQRGDQAPVGGAGIWAIGKDSIAGVREQIDELRSSGQLRNTDIDTLLSPYGFFLGTTGSDGQLTYTFAEKGRYLLVTVQKGYVPGICGIVITGPPANNNNEAADADLE